MALDHRRGTRLSPVVALDNVERFPRRWTIIVPHQTCRRCTVHGTPSLLTPSFIVRLWCNYPQFFPVIFYQYVTFLLRFPPQGFHSLSLTRYGGCTRRCAVRYDHGLKLSRLLSYLPSRPGRTSCYGSRSPEPKRNLWTNQRGVWWEGGV